MRTVELGKVAVAAEALILRREARRQIFRVAFGAAAAVFALAVLVVLHFVIYQALTLYMQSLYAALLVLALDFVVTAVFGALAARGGPDPIQTEARQIRHQAVAELKRSLTVMGMTAEVAGLVLRTRATSRVRSGMAGTLATIASRLIGR